MKRALSSTLNFAIVLLSVVLVLFILELVLRVRKGELTQTDNLLFKSHNFQPDRLSVGYPEQVDPNLGWVPKPQIRGVDRSSGSPVQTLENGIRSNGGQPINGSHRILAIGDSFTWGEQVSDNETWPAYLQQNTHTPVVNAGVSGYGIDQAVLRGEALFYSIKPTHVILSFIGNDIIRCGWSKAWGMQKPFFTVSNNGLELKNVPVPEHKVIPPKLDPLRDFLGRSYLANALMIRVNPSYWLADLGYTFELVEPRYEEVACLLLKRLKKAGEKLKFDILVVAQYEESLSRDDLTLTKNLLTCAEKTGLKTLDLLPLMEEMRKKGEAEYTSFINWHHTAIGNKLVAEQIAKHFSDKNL